MSKKELFEKIEKALDMVISIRGRKYRILRDADDWLTITERSNRESRKQYTDTSDLISRYKIDGKPLRDYIDVITIEKYTALLDT